MTKAATTKPTPAELLTLLVERAPALRKAGIQHVSIEGLSATLAPPELDPANVPKPKPQRTPHPDPLRDPDTYPGGRVPGFELDDETRQR